MIDHFNWFLYTEDDLDIPGHTVLQWMAETSFLQGTHYLPGVFSFLISLQYLRAQNTTAQAIHEAIASKYKAQLGAQYQPQAVPSVIASVGPANVWAMVRSGVFKQVSVSGRVFLEVTGSGNVYQGAYLLPRSMLRRFVQTPKWSTMDCNHMFKREFYASFWLYASGPVEHMFRVKNKKHKREDCFVPARYQLYTKLVPLDKLPLFWMHHMGEKGRQNQSEERMLVDPNVTSRVISLDHMAAAHGVRFHLLPRNFTWQPLPGDGGTSIQGPGNVIEKPPTATPSS